MIVFDTTPGLARFRAIYYEGGSAPDFVPPWREVDRIDVGEELPERDRLGAIDGFFYRHAVRRRRGRRAAPAADIVWSSPGDWRAVRELYRKYDKACPWRLRRITAPEWAIDAAKL